LLTGPWNLRTKLLALLFLPLIVFLLTTVTAILRMSAMADDLTQSLYVETYQSSKLIQNAAGYMNKALVAQRTLIFTDYKSNKYRSIYETYKNSVKEAVSNTEQAKTFVLRNERNGRIVPPGAGPDVPELIDEYLKAFEQWETRSNTIIESMSTRGLRGEDKIIFQGLILDEAIAADEKFDTANKIIQNIESILGRHSAEVTAEIKDNKQQLQLVLILVASLTFSAALVFSLLLSRGILLSIKDLVLLTKRVARGELNIEPMNVRSRDEIGLLTASFLSMCGRLREYIDIAFVSKFKEKEAELRALQLQIQPHFLFNTLEVIRMKAVQGGARQIAAMIKILADIYRWNVKGQNAIVTLEEELHYTLSYLQLQEIRFQDRLRVTTDIPGDLLSMGVPKLILQPLVENAVRHGFPDRAEACEIRISARMDGGDLVLACADNGEGIEPERLASLRKQLTQGTSRLDSIGVSNVHSRIALLYGPPYGMTIDSRNGAGSEFTIRLPAQYVQEMRTAYVESFAGR
jgi:sensor histidine kinase YesM